MMEMIIGILAILYGAFTLAKPNWNRDRIAKRVEEGDDRFFEEQRSYEAYPQWKNTKYSKFGSAALIASGLLLLAISLG